MKIVVINREKPALSVDQNLREVAKTISFHWIPAATSRRFSTCLALQRDFGLNCHSEALFAEESALASRDSSQTTAQNDKSRCSTNQRL